MIVHYLVFRYVKGRCHGNQLILIKCHERRLMPLAFFAQSFENELQYHCQNVRINSRGDMAISGKNLLNFCQVLQRLWSSFENVRYDTAKKPLYLVKYLRIYWTNFCNLFTI